MYEPFPQRLKPRTRPPVGALPCRRLPCRRPIATHSHEIDPGQVLGPSQCGRRIGVTDLDRIVHTRLVSATGRSGSFMDRHPTVAALPLLGVMALLVDTDVHRLITAMATFGPPIGAAIAVGAGFAASSIGV